MPSPVLRASTRIPAWRLVLTAVACLIVAVRTSAADLQPWHKVGRAAQLIGSDFVRPTDPRQLELAALHGLWAASRRRDPVPERDVTGDFEVFDRIASQVCGPGPSQAPLIDGAIQALVQSLQDPYSRYLDAAAYRQFKEDRAGHFAGIGVRVSNDSGVARVLTVLAGSSAWREGLRAGDQLNAIDGLPAGPLASERIAQRLRGPTGSRVSLTVRRGTRSWRMTVVRQPIVDDPIITKWLPDHLAYVRLASFANTRAVVEMRHALASIQNGHPAGLVLDLQHNPGGDVDVAKEIGGLFIGEAVMVTTMDRAGKVNTLQSRGSPILAATVPITVLIDGASASAAEILAAALRHGRQAQLVGERSFGKGCIQVIQGLRDGTALVLTTRLYFTADGHLISGVGLAPDVPVTHPVGIAFGSAGDPVLAAATTELQRRRAQFP